MLRPSTNIIPKYRYETHYNYVRSSVFFASNCSPLLCYRSVTTALTAQIPNGNAITKPQGFSCSPLLCYRFVTTTLTAQIPNGNAIANLLGSLHTGKTCSPLLCYRKANRTNSCGNAIAKPQALLHRESKRLRDRLFLLRSTVLRFGFDDGLVECGSYGG